MPAAGDLKWFICDNLGNPVKRIGERENGKVEIPLNGQRRAGVTISMEDPAVAEIKPLSRLLKVWYRDLPDPVCNGIIMRPRFDYTNGTVEINSVDAGFRLERSFTVNYSWGAGPRPIPNALWDLIWTLSTRYSVGVGVELGIMVGDLLGGGVIEGIGFKHGEIVWSKIQEWAALFGAPDFALQPVDRTDGKHWKFSTGALGDGVLGIGNDRSATIRFDYNCLNHNLAGFTHEPGGEETRTRYISFGGPLPDAVSDGSGWAIAWAPSSELAYGIYEEWEVNDRTDIQYQRAKAQEMVAAYHDPPDFFTIVPGEEGDVPGFAVPPRFGKDYFTGDVVHAVARKGLCSFETNGRIVKSTISEKTAESGASVEHEVTPRPAATTINVYSEPAP